MRVINLSFAALGLVDYPGKRLAILGVGRGGERGIIPRVSI